MKTTNLTILICLLALMGQTAPTLAQMRGEGTQNFFDRGDRLLQQEIQKLQQQEQNQQESNQKPQPVLNVGGNTAPDSQVTPKPDSPNPSPNSVPESPDHK